MKNHIETLPKEMDTQKSELELYKEGFKCFIESSIDPVFVIDKENTILFANAAAARLFATPPEDLIYTRFDYQVRFGEITEIVIRHGSGKSIKAEIHVTKAIWDGDFAYVVSFRNKANRNGLEEMLVQTNTWALPEKHLSKILESISAAIISVDETGIIIRANRAVEKIFGYHAPKLIGESIGLLIPQQLVGGSTPNIYEYFSKKCDLQGATRILGRRKDGTEFPVEVTGSKITVGGKALLTITMTDITEHENQLRNQRMESIGLLASGIAHDMNNILTPILSASDFLKPYVENPTASKHLDLMTKSAMRGANLIRQLLTFARGNIGQKTEIELGSLIDDMKHFVEQTFPKTITLESFVPRDLFLVSFDPTQMQQVLINLLLNARDAMPNGGVLKIHAENFVADKSYTKMHHEAKEGPYVAVTITDTGVGIHPEVLPKIFEPFFTTKQPGHGTGLGLATTYSIIYNHGGFIRVSSQLGSGTSFKLFLPAFLSKASEHDLAEKTLMHKGNGELILVVDDEDAIQEVTADILTSSGYRVICASDGSKAVAAFAQNSHDVKAVILDMMMPVMDGPATIHALRNINPAVKIIAVSGLMDAEAIARRVSGAIIEVLTKPYTSQSLLVALYKLIHSELKDA
ncbi:MAG: PAS domain S-box protein [Chlorobiales bacterium]|nr:PAS domain S-box protein [Chlorobiales bacterium]